MVELTDKAIRAPMTSIALSPRGPGLWTGCPHYVSAMQWKSDVKVSLTRVILYVQDVERIASFYCDALGLAVTEEIKGEWAVLRAGQKSRFTAWAKLIVWPMQPTGRPSATRSWFSQWTANFRNCGRN